MLLIPLEVLDERAIKAAKADKVAYQIYGKKSILTIINVEIVFFIFDRMETGQS
jgi:hypothetical protein